MLKIFFCFEGFKGFDESEASYEPKLVTLDNIRQNIFKKIKYILKIFLTFPIFPILLSLKSFVNA